MWGEDPSAREARRQKRREQRAEARRKAKAERYARKLAEREKQRQEDEQFLSHLVEKMTGRGELAPKAAEVKPLSRGFGFGQQIQVAPVALAGRVAGVGGDKPGAKGPGWSPPVPLKRPV
ncbi:MAG: hypothetical protein RL417_1993 [Pseudomonadota bacterium]|jgi:hypothetical protein